MYDNGVFGICLTDLWHPTLSRAGSRKRGNFLFFDIVLHERRRPLTRGRGLKRRQHA
jgi:hypothetical protein